MRSVPWFLFQFPGEVIRERRALRADRKGGPARFSAIEDQVASKGHDQWERK
jgi:hypothetical protein